MRVSYGTRSRTSATVLLVITAVFPQLELSSVMTLRRHANDDTASGLKAKWREVSRSAYLHHTHEIREDLLPLLHLYLVAK